MSPDERRTQVAERHEQAKPGRRVGGSHSWEGAGCPVCGSRDIRYEKSRKSWLCREWARIKDQRRSRGYDGEISDYRAQRLLQREPEDVRFDRNCQPGDFPSEWLPSEVNKGRESTPCLIWTGQKAAKGKMGSFRRADAKIVGAHVFALERALGHAIGEHEDGSKLHVNHICRVPLCVEPHHLEEVTTQVNTKLGSRAQQTHCKRDHEFTPENTYVWTDKKNRPHRSCRACRSVKEVA